MTRIVGILLGLMAIGFSITVIGTTDGSLSCAVDGYCSAVGFLGGLGTALIFTAACLLLVRK